MPHRFLRFGLQRLHLFIDKNRVLGADLDAFAAMRAALLPDPVRGKARLARDQLLPLDGEVLADLRHLSHMVHLSGSIM